MFDIGWSELVVIGVIALIAIGPKELPGVLRTVGQYMGKVRRMAAEFQGQFQEAMREAEMADLKKQVDDITDAAKDVTKGLTDFDPLESVKKDFDSVAASVSDMDPAHTSTTESAAAGEPVLAAPTEPVVSEPVVSKPVLPEPVLPPLTEPPSEPSPVAPDTTHHVKSENAKPENTKPESAA
jgi:sec-independent protein translocase protein TatB